MGMITFKEGNLRIPKWNRRVFVVAGGTTAYRKHFPEYKIEELAMMAFKQMLEANGLKKDPLEVKGLINYAAYGEFADHFQDQLLCEAKIHDYLGLDPLYNTGIKTGGATGGSTVLNAAMAVASGYANVALAMGWERMDEVDTRTGNFYISTAACKDFETRLGRVYSSYYAPMANRFSWAFNVSEKTRAKIAVKNRLYACSSPYAQQPGKHTVEEVLASPMAAYPLRFLECCAMSVGAACVLVCDEETAYQLTDHPCELFICGGTHTLRVADRRDMEIPLLPNETPEMYKDFLKREAVIRDLRASWRPGLQPGSSIGWPGSRIPSKISISSSSMMPSPSVTFKLMEILDSGLMVRNRTILNPEMPSTSIPIPGNPADVPLTCQADSSEPCMRLERLGSSRRQSVYGSSSRNTINSMVTRRSGRNGEKKNLRIGRAFRFLKRASRPCGSPMQVWVPT